MNCIGNMCPFVKKKKEKSVVFSLTYRYYETAYTIQPRRTPPIIPTPPIIRDLRVICSPWKKINSKGALFVRMLIFEK